MGIDLKRQQEFAMFNIAVCLCLDGSSENSDRPQNGRKVVATWGKGGKSEDCVNRDTDLVPCAFRTPTTPRDVRLGDYQRELPKPDVLRRCLLIDGVTTVQKQQGHIELA